MPTISSRAVELETPWFQLIAKTVTGLADSQPDQVYFALKPHDYVTVLALTPDREVLLVRQYRPVIERATLELPSGHVEDGQTPEEAARQELLEETGYEAGDLELLGALAPDSGRMDNRQWCFLASDVRSVPQAPEAGIELVLMDLDELIEGARQGEFNHALHLAVLMLAMLRGKLPNYPAK